MKNELMWILPELVLLSMICVTLLAGLLVPIMKRRVVSYCLAQLSLVLTGALLVFYAVASGYFQKVIFFAGFSQQILFSPISVVMEIFIVVISSLALIYSRHYIRDHGIEALEYFLLALFSVLGMMIMVSGYSFLSLYLGLELSALPIYAMVALQKNITRTSEAAMKYFVMGALASGLFLYGVSLIYGVTGSINLSDIHAFVPASGHTRFMFMIGLVFVLCGLIFKFGAVPFHMWVPDVYEGAPTTVTAFIAGAPKVAVLGMTYTILVLGIPPSMQPQWQQILIVVVVLSMALGNILAIAQTNIKRMLAYSSIAQLGYMLLGFVADSNQGYSMSLFYAGVYGLMVIGAFAMIALLNKVGYEVETLDHFRGLNARSPWLAFLMLLLMFSMAGVPPTVGFFAKVGVLEALVDAHMVWLAVLALVFALIGAFYYLRIVKLMYFDKPDLTQFALPKISWDAQVVLGVNCIAILVFGMMPSGLIEVCCWAFKVVL